jgi:hypothetical protein
MAGVTSIRDTSSWENASVEEIKKRINNIDKEKFFDLKNTIVTSSELAQRHFNIFHSPSGLFSGRSFLRPAVRARLGFGSLLSLGREQIRRFFLGDFSFLIIPILI